jgi:uncharacterized protein DUF4232
MPTISRTTSARRTARSRRGCLLALSVVAIAATACTKAPAPTAAGPSTSSVAQSPAETTSTAATTEPTRSGPATSSTTSASAIATASKSTTPVGPAGCRTSALSVDVERGSGAAGHQFATIVFTNKSTSTCSITGFPGVQLLAAGKPLANPANRSGKPFSRVDLAPHAIGTAMLENDSTCNAENSDSVQVIVPNQTDTVVLPLRFRGCTLTIDPVARS